MPAPSQPMKQTARRIPLSAIDAAVAARLGPGRVCGNAQPAVFSRQVAMYLAKHVGGWSTTRIGQILQWPGSFDGMLRIETSGVTSRG